ncbi:MAG: hypothetical protein ACFFDN_28130 [Candidatus Hodarchaeota archaeon]
MINNKETMKTLFLIKNETEYQSATKLLESRDLTDYDMLSIQSEYPYLVNDLAHNHNVSHWQKYDVIDFPMSRYWLYEYKTIEEIINAELARTDKYQNRLLQSPYFTFSLVYYFGNQYYESITVLNDFFSNNNIETVFFNPTDDFIGNLISSLVSHYNIKYLRLPL